MEALQLILDDAIDEGIKKIIIETDSNGESQRVFYETPSGWKEIAMLMRGILSSERLREECERLDSLESIEVKKECNSGQSKCKNYPVSIMESIDDGSMYIVIGDCFYG